MASKSTKKGTILNQRHLKNIAWKIRLCLRKKKAQFRNN